MSSVPAVKRHRLGPYMPYQGRKRSTTFIGHDAKGEKGDIHFEVERVSDENPKVVDPDEVRIVMQPDIINDKIHNVQGETPNNSIATSMFHQTLEYSCSGKGNFETLALQGTAEQPDCCVNEIIHPIIVDTAETDSESFAVFKQTVSTSVSNVQELPKLTKFLHISLNDISTQMDNVPRSYAILQEGTEWCKDSPISLKEKSLVPNVTSRNPVYINTVNLLKKDTSMSDKLRHKFDVKTFSIVIEDLELVLEKLSKSCLLNKETLDRLKQNTAKQNKKTNYTSMSSGIDCYKNVHLSFEEEVAKKLAERRKIYGDRSCVTSKHISISPIIEVSTTPMLNMQSVLNPQNGLYSDAVNRNTRLNVSTLPTSPECVQPPTTSRDSPQCVILSKEFATNSPSSTDSTIDKFEITENNECKAIRTVPVHPRLRMKLKSNNCNCNTDPCIYKNFNSISLTNSASYSNTQSLTPHSTEIDLSLPAVCVTKKEGYNQDKSNSIRSFLSYSPTTSATRPSIIPKSSPKSPRSILSQTINAMTHSLSSVEGMHLLNQKSNSIYPVGYLNSSSSEVLSSDNFDGCYTSDLVHISSDEVGSQIEIFCDKDERLFVPSPSNKDIKPTPLIKKEDDLEGALQSNIDFQSTHLCKHAFPIKPAAILPTLLKTAEFMSFNDESTLSGRLIKSISKRQMIKLVKRFNLKRLKVEVVKLNTKTIENLVQLCTFHENWYQRGFLLRTGLTEYDINRLCLAGFRQKTDFKYGFRKFLRRRKVFQSLAEKPLHLKGSSRELLSINSQKKKLQQLILAQNKEEKIRRDLESIRRSLLKINARFLQQSNFWFFLSQGSSSSQPIEL